MGDNVITSKSGIIPQIFNTMEYAQTKTVTDDAIVSIYILNTYTKLHNPRSGLVKQKRTWYLCIH